MRLPMSKHAGQNETCYTSGANPSIETCNVRTCKKQCSLQSYIYCRSTLRVRNRQMYSEVAGWQKPPCEMVGDICQSTSLAILQLQGPQAADLIKLLGTASFVSTTVTACYSTTPHVTPCTARSNKCFHGTGVSSLSIQYCLAALDEQT